jgi:hypothetical protein
LFFFPFLPSFLPSCLLLFLRFLSSNINSPSLHSPTHTTPDLVLATTNCAMASNLTVNLGGGKKQLIKTTPAMSLRQVVNTVCEKQGYPEPETYGLKYEQRTSNILSLALLPGPTPPCEQTSPFSFCSARPPTSSAHERSLMIPLDTTPY